MGTIPKKGLNVIPAWYNTPMMKETKMNNNNEVYDILAQINAALIAQKIEQEEWVREYDRKHRVR